MISTHFRGLHGSVLVPIETLNLTEVCSLNTATRDRFDEFPDNFSVGISTQIKMSR